MKFHKITEYIEKNKAEFYEKLLAEEQEVLTGIRKENVLLEADKTQPKDRSQA